MNSEMIESLAKAMGKTTNETAALLDKNPRLKKLLSEINEQDARKLMEVLSDKESMAKVLATPQAKSIIEGMSKR